MSRDNSAHASASRHHEQLVRQFVLARSDAFLPASWPAVRIGGQEGWTLAHHSALPVLDVESRDGHLIGYLLGWPIDEHRGLVSAQSGVNFQLDVDSRRMPDQDEEPPLEKALYRLGGRWAFILAPSAASGGGRVYLDPLGSQPVVYSPPLRLVAATTALIPHTEATGYDTELVALMGLPQQDKWFPFGLTPRRSCFRLLPNHYLDLAAMRPVRHWPLGGSKGEEGTVDEAVERIAGILKRHVASIVRVSPVLCSLTGGKDTRTLLAACREHTDRIAFYTFEGHRANAQVVQRDIYTARRLARRFGLSHRTIPREEASEAEMHAWFERTGECVAGAVMRNVAMRDGAGFRDGFRISGIFSIAPGGYYKDREPIEAPTPRELIERMRLPVSDRVIQAGEAWLDAMPATTHRLWDLLKWENRIGAWAAPQIYGSAQPGVMLWPGNHREIVTAALNLPWRYKRKRLLARDVIHHLWPELLEIPINEDFGLLKFRRRAKSALNRLDPRRLLRS